MDSQISRAFDLAKEKLTQYKRLNAELDTLAVKERALKASLEKEDADVEKVETKNIATAFYSVVGTLDKHVEKERSEAFAARQKYDQIRKDMEDVKKLISVLTAGQTGLEDCQKEYDRLYALKKDEIMRINGEAAQKILALAESASRAKINLEKTDAASGTAAMVFDMVNTIIKSLNKAIGSGVTNTVYTDFLTIKHVEEKMKELENNETLLLQLKTQLDEVHINSDFIITGEGTTSFAFKKLYNPRVLADWGATSRITELKKVQEGLLRVKTRLWDVCEALKKMSASVTGELTNLEAEIDSIIVN